MQDHSTPPAAHGRELGRNPRCLWHFAAVALVALVVGILFIHEPGFGDDFTYWSLAFDLHHSGPTAWLPESFHDLRWPVWGPIWLAQWVFGMGLSSYYFEPLLYLMAAACIVFAFARVLALPPAGAWLGVLALLFAPVLDVVIFRPMPDLSEGVFGGGAVLAWWAMMQAESTRKRALFGILSGAAIGLAFSNRATGIFIAPVLAVATFTLYPRRWKWLLVPALVSVLYFLGEGAVYHWVCGDWLHSLHANSGATHAKDVQPTTWGALPFRYFAYLVHGNHLAKIYVLLTGLGLWAAWRHHGKAGRLLLLWFVVLFGEYSCAVQSLHPLLPLVGSTLRYVAAFALPMALLAMLGVVEISKWLSRLNWPAWSTRFHFWKRQPALGLALVAAALAFSTTRPFFNLGFVPEFRRYEDTLPAGTHVFTHHAMFDLAYLADPAAAQRLVFNVPGEFLVQNQKAERLAEGSEEFWYLRKYLWLTERKRIENKDARLQPHLGSYLDQPERQWRLSGAIEKVDEPEIFLFHRRTPGSPAPLMVDLLRDETTPGLPKIPVDWNAAASPRKTELEWKIPISLRGRMVLLAVKGQAATLEPATVQIHFETATASERHVSLHPTFYPEGGKDLISLRIPADAERAHIQVQINAKEHAIHLEEAKVMLEASDGQTAPQPMGRVP